MGIHRLGHGLFSSQMEQSVVTIYGKGLMEIGSNALKSTFSLVTKSGIKSFIFANFGKWKFMPRIFLHYW
jgi:hypothetical protein